MEAVAPVARSARMTTRRRRDHRPMEVPAAVRSRLLLQHGIISREQLRAAGWSRHVIAGLLGRGVLVRLHPSTYAFGSPPTALAGRMMAAVLAAGPGSFVSHESAAVHLGLMRRRVARIDVTCPRRHRGLVGARVAHSRDCPGDDVVDVDGVPTSSPTRTIVDLAARLRPEYLVRVMDECAYRGLLDLDALEEVLAARDGRRGRRVLRDAVDLYVRGSRGVRSRYEMRAVDWVRRRGETPVPNVRLRVGHGGPIEVDLAWMDERICVELDGPGHDRPTARRRDGERDARLHSAGYQVFRIRQADHDADAETAWASALAALRAARAQRATALRG